MDIVYLASGWRLVGRHLGLALVCDAPAVAQGDAMSWDIAAGLLALGLLVYLVAVPAAPGGLLMSSPGWMQLVAYLVILLLFRPAGAGDGGRDPGALRMGTSRGGALYRLAGIDADQEQGWLAYAVGPFSRLQWTGLQHRGQLRHQHQLAGLRRRGDDELPDADAGARGAELPLGGHRHRGGGGPGPRLRPPEAAAVGNVWVDLTRATPVGSCCRCRSCSRWCWRPRGDPEPGKPARRSRRWNPSPWTQRGRRRRSRRQGRKGQP